MTDLSGKAYLVVGATPVVEQDGVILGISAVVAEGPMPNMAVYSAVTAATAALLGDETDVPSSAVG